MSTISYVVLAMLVRKSLSGQEIKQYLQLFWEAHHSQIYPVLKKLRSEGLIEIVDTPDGKTKIYAITEAGKVSLKPWILEENKPPTQKDEFLAKLYALSLIDDSQVQHLIDNRKIYYLNLLEKYQRLYVPVEELGENRKKEFSRMLVINRKIRLCKEEVVWCEWAREQIETYLR